MSIRRFRNDDMMCDENRGDHDETIKEGSIFLAEAADNILDSTNPPRVSPCETFPPRVSPWRNFRLSSFSLLLSLDLTCGGECRPTESISLALPASASHCGGGGVVDRHITTATIKTKIMHATTPTVYVVIHRHGST